ncbi:hypothetical protein LDENG_00232900 [Lucifuga dentata]|nr:hypothetical protein LDENG_00232900 [Lucifuga dentata]
MPPGPGGASCASVCVCMCWGGCLGVLPGLLFRWSACLLRWCMWVPFLAPGLVCCPGSPLSPWSSASWVSFHLGRAARPCGFCWTCRRPRALVRFCV